MLRFPCAIQVTTLEPRYEGLLFDIVLGPLFRNTVRYLEGRKEDGLDTPLRNEVLPSC